MTMRKKKPANKKETPRLEVYPTRSVLIHGDGTEQEFREGDLSDAARQRMGVIRKALDEGFLRGIFQECQRPDVMIEPLHKDHSALLFKMVSSVTSEQGRAIVGLAVLQLAIKAIEPSQSIRLHKGGGKGNNFSWADGLPMRVLDTTYSTPLLRQYDLIRLNADGVFMTRSLAENYPYSRLYKAALRGAKSEWLEVVDLIEAGQLNAALALRHLLAMLFNQSERFKILENKAIANAQKAIKRIDSLDDALRFVSEFVDASTYSARIFEIAMHSFFQVLEDAGAFDGYLKPLSQMRSANKKHGNIGDIEITRRRGGLEILEAWDAKYDKPYLRDEIEELAEKLNDHPETQVAGFVVSGEPSKKAEMAARIAELEQNFGIKIEIANFERWVRTQAERAQMDSKTMGANWVIAFTECLCQRRRERAPIDEPCHTWVDELNKYAKTWK